jgi:hypothetical protein
VALAAGELVLSFLKAQWDGWLWGVVVFLLGAKIGLLWADVIKGWKAKRNPRQHDNRT